MWYELRGLLAITTAGRLFKNRASLKYVGSDGSYAGTIEYSKGAPITNVTAMKPPYLDTRTLLLTPANIPTAITKKDIATPFPLATMTPAITLTPLHTPVQKSWKDAHRAGSPVLYCKL